jgi:SAM-dependent methyltransferase
MNTREALLTEIKDPMKAVGRRLKIVPRWIRTLTNKHVCPVCGKRIRGFDPLSGYYAESKKCYNNPYGPDDVETMNATQYSCPHCMASDRDRLYALYLNRRLRQLHPPNAISLLDIAPSKPLRAFITRFDQVLYRSADLQMQDVDDCVDIMDMGAYKDSSFDAFICSHVLEHVPDDRRALSELFRILKPTGWGILMVPINLVIGQIDEDPSVTEVAERWRRFGQHDHIRLYSRQGFLERVAGAGFVVCPFGVDFFGAGAFRRHGVSNRSVLYVVEKQ